MERMDPDSAAELLKQAERLQTKALALVVVHGRISLDDDQSYRARRTAIDNECWRLGLDHPFTWETADELQAWGRSVGGYAKRRRAVEELVRPFLKRLESLSAGAKLDDWSERQGFWDDLEQRLEGLKARVTEAETLDDFQDVGRRAREIIIDAVNCVFSAEMVAAGETVPQKANAKDRLDYVLAHYSPGDSHEKLRHLMRSALTLAQGVTHSTGITRTDAFAAGQATVLIVRTLAEMYRMGSPEPAEA